MSSEVPQITTSIRRRLADLQTYQLPRLRECKGPIDLQRELSAELKEDIRRIKRSLDVRAALCNSTVMLMAHFTGIGRAGLRTANGEGEDGADERMQRARKRPRSVRPARQSHTVLL